MIRRMLRPCVGTLMVAAALAAPGVASAQNIDGDTLDLFANAQGQLQIIPTGQSSGIFSPPNSAAPDAGIAAVIDGVSVPLGAGRTTVSGPTLTQLGFGASALDSVYTLDSNGGAPDLQVEETLGFVTGTPLVTGIYTFTNISGGALTSVRVGALANLFAGGSDFGVGELSGAAPGRQLLGVNPINGWKVGLFEDTLWSAYQTGVAGNVFANFAGPSLDGSVDPNFVDNAVGAQWDLGPMAIGAVSPDIGVGWYFQPAAGQPGPTPTPAPPAPPTPAQTPTPDLGKSVVAFTSKGKVRVKVPGSSRFVDLDSLQELPLGTVFDTTKGQVTLTSAADAAGTTQKAWFYEGIFKIGQTKGAKPLTTLALAGDKPACAKPQRANARKGAASRKKPKSRRLWGDGKGRFQTKGQFSSATVRGTKWLVQDRCDGTLTKVVNGSVTVRDFVKDKDVIVKAGRSYLAKRPGG